MASRLEEAKTSVLIIRPADLLHIIIIITIMYYINIIDTYYVSAGYSHVI